MSIIKTLDKNSREWRINFTWYNGYPEKCINGQWFPKDPEDVVFDTFEVYIFGKWFEMPQRVAEKFLNLDTLDLSDDDTIDNVY